MIEAIKSSLMPEEMKDSFAEQMKMRLQVLK